MDLNFLEKVTNGDEKALFDFILHIQHGIISKEMFHAALEKHYKFLQNAIEVSVMGIKNMDATVKKNGHEYTFPDLLVNIIDSNKLPYFRSIKPTELTEDEGQYILMTTKGKLMKAEKALDRFTIGLTTEGIHNFSDVTGCSMKSTTSKP